MHKKPSKVTDNSIIVNEVFKNKKQEKVKLLDYPDIAPWVLTTKQKEYYDNICENKIIFSYGPAGTAKTAIMCWAAINLLIEGKIKKIVLTKPIKEAGEELGFLPGTIEDKTDPYMESYFTNFLKILKGNEKKLEFLLKEKIIEVRPLAYMRGITLENCIMLLDEAQNAIESQIMLFITRMGKNSKVVVAGDISQHDILSKHVSLDNFSQELNGVKGIGYTEFKKEDIVRDPILIEIVDIYETRIKPKILQKKK